MDAPSSIPGVANRRAGKVGWASPVSFQPRSGIDRAVLDSSLLRRTLRTGTDLLAGALHAQALTLTELGKLAESLADLLGGREHAQGRPPTVATPASAAASSFREDGELSGDAMPAWPIGQEPADRASLRDRDVAGTTSAARAGPSGGGPASSAPASRLRGGPAADHEPATSGTAPPSGTAVQAGPSPAAPAHVDEEAILVAESADQGAEEGPGASIH